MNEAAIGSSNARSVLLVAEAPSGSFARICLTTVGLYTSSVRQLVRCIERMQIVKNLCVLR